MRELLVNLSIYKVEGYIFQSWAERLITRPAPYRLLVPGGRVLPAPDAHVDALHIARR